MGQTKCPGYLVCNGYGNVITIYVDVQWKPAAISLDRLMDCEPCGHWAPLKKLGRTRTMCYRRCMAIRHIIWRVHDELSTTTHTQKKTKKNKESSVSHMHVHSSHKARCRLNSESGDFRITV